MSDVGANRDELPMAILKSFYSQRNVDTAYSSDDFERYKRENCCELRGGRLNFYEKGEPDHNTTTTVMKVERRRGTNILILRCGPGGRTVIFLEFDSMRLTGEWQEALCRCTGQPYDPNPALRRVRSEITAAANKWKRRALITRSAFADSDPVDKQVDSDSEQVDPSSTTPQEAPLEAPQESPLAPPVTPPEGLSAPPARAVAHPSSTVSSSDERVSETSNTDSVPASLRSRDDDLSQTLTDLAKNSVEKVFNISDLQQLKVMDYKGDVIVTEANPLCQLHVGDKIVFRNPRGFRMNAQELTEHIRPSIVLTIVRGAVFVCTAREEEHELNINIKGSQTVRLDSVDFIRRALTSPCFLHYAEMPELSNLTITEINSTPVPIGSQANQIDKIMKEALETSGGKLTLHAVPQSLLDAMAE